MIVGPIEIKPVTATAASGPSLSALLAGKVIEARLTLALADGLFRFSTPEGDIDLALPRNLPPGTKVSIASQPGGALEVTVLTDEGLPAPSVRPVPTGAAASLPPLNVTVRPRGPMPVLPPGQPVDAKVISNPGQGTVRVAIGSTEVDLPLARPLPAGTQIRLLPQPGGTVQVSLQPPSAKTAPVSSPAQSAPSPAPVSHPSVFTVKPTGTVPQLPAGQVVEARVVATPENGPVRFTSPEGEFELPLPKTFPPGTLARVVAQPGGAFVVTVRPDPPKTDTAHSTAALPQSAPAALPKPITIQPGLALPSFPPGQAIEARVAAPPINGAPAGMVAFTSPLGDFELPLAQALPPGMPVRVLPQPNGGLTLVPMPDMPDVAAAKPMSARPPATPAEAVRQALGSAVARQDGMANLFADIEELPVRSDVPVPVRKAAETLLSQRLPLESVARPEQLAKAIAGSGLFAERMLAGLPEQAKAPPDLKLALFVLRAALGSWTSVRTETPMHEAHLPPPAPGMPPAAQAPADPAHPRSAEQGRGTERTMAAAGPEDIVPRLMSETESAISRVNLHQIASLPDERAAGRADAPDARWSCEVPINVDGRTAVFGFVIERDGQHTKQEKEKRRWRVRAAIDLQETGAVEADVRLRGETVMAGLIVERPETATMLEAALPMLRDGLTAAGFDVETLSVRLGKAVPQAGPPGHFVDRKT